MSDIINVNSEFKFDFSKPEDRKHIAKICYALSSEDRVKVMSELLLKSKNLSDLAKDLYMSISTVSRYIDDLSEAQLISINYQPTLKGHIKSCSRIAPGFQVTFENKEEKVIEKKEYFAEMPVGFFTSCHIESPCGMIGSQDALIPYDKPQAFFTPKRIDAECIWFGSGFLSYSFPNLAKQHNAYSEISFSFEICSEANYYNNNWPSDITISVNDLDVLTYTSPGDFGGRRGKLTPQYWPITSTQYGLLKKVTINENGVYLDDNLVNKTITIDNLHLDNDDQVLFKLAVKPDAIHKGGMNLFGKNFGDFNQAIIMKVK